MEQEYVFLLALATSPPLPLSSRAGNATFTLKNNETVAIDLHLEGSLWPKMFALMGHPTFVKGRDRRQQWQR